MRSRSSIAVLAGTFLAVLVWAGCGTDVSGPSASLQACLVTDARDVPVGDAILFDGTGNRSVCLSAPETGATYVYVPFRADPPPDEGGSRKGLAVRVLGAGITVPAGVVATPAGDAGPALFDPPGLRLGHELHAWVRSRERKELGPLLAPQIDPGAPPREGAGLAHIGADGAPPAIGSTRTLNVALSCSVEDLRTARVMAASDRAVILAEVGFEGRFAAAEYARVAEAFDRWVHPVVARHFGEPTDIDGNGRVLVFYTSAVNRMNVGEVGSVTAGLFWAGDLFPATAAGRLQGCPAGNRAELFYLLVPDPTGAMGPVVPANWIADRAVQVMVHEYQHLVNAARRMYVNDAPVFEETWLNEGLSHIAEELLFYEATGLEPGANLTWGAIQAAPGAAAAYERYMGGNHINLRRFLPRPDTTSPMGIDGLATRGATWSFLRYIADRAGRGDAALFRELVNSTRAGLDNLDRVVGARALDWMHDWGIALYADDLVPGLDARHTHRSWNLRDIHRVPGGGYHLGTGVLDPGVSHEVALVAGGSGHLTFAIPPGGRAAVHVEAGGGSPPRALRGAFLRVR
jgi:hypothetical protein